MFSEGSSYYSCGITGSNCSLQWVGARHVVPAQAPLLGSVLKTISTARIVKAQNAPGGTQLKLLVTLEGGQKALFKPQW